MEGSVLDEIEYDVEAPTRCNVDVTIEWLGAVLHFGNDRARSLPSLLSKCHWHLMEGRYNVYRWDIQWKQAAQTRELYPNHYWHRYYTSFASLSS